MINSNMSCDFAISIMESDELSKIPIEEKSVDSHVSLKDVCDFQPYDSYIDTDDSSTNHLNVTTKTSTDGEVSLEYSTNLKPLEVSDSCEGKWCPDETENFTDAKVSPYEEYDSDATIITEPGVFKIERASGDFRPPDSRAFSPLPSTSSDNVTSDINDLRLSEASGVAVHSSLIVLDDEFREADGRVTPPMRSPPAIIECSSGSEEDVAPPPPRSSEVINLLLDDSCDNNSDCEIVNVDSLVAENLQFLVTEEKKVTCSERHTGSNQPTMRSVQELVEEYFKTNISPTSNPSDSNSIEPTFDLSVSLAEAVPDQNGILNISPESVLHTAIPTSIKNHLLEFFGLSQSRVLRKRHKKRREHHLHNTREYKRRKCTEIVDLSDGHNPVPVPLDSSSEVIIIDSDSPAQLSGGIGSNIVLNATLPVAKMPNPPRNNLGDCPVCWDNLYQKAIASTFCGHIFCLPCITVIMKTSKKCPTCRKALRGKGFHPIFI